MQAFFSTFFRIYIIFFKPVKLKNLAILCGFRAFFLSISTHNLPFILELPLVELPSIGRTHQRFSGFFPLFRMNYPKNFLLSSPKNLDFSPHDAALPGFSPLLALNYSIKSAPKQASGRKSQSREPPGPGSRAVSLAVLSIKIKFSRFLIFRIWRA